MISIIAVSNNSTDNQYLHIMVDSQSEAQVPGATARLMLSGPVAV